MPAAVAEPRPRAFHVRQAEPGDAAALVELARAVGAEPEGWLVTDGDWRTAAEERRYLRAIRRSSHAAVLVAESPERIVGRLSLSRDPHPASRHVADLGLMVAHDFRRRGVGKALMHAAEDWARVVGVRKLELHVFPYNDGAIALYEQLGYRREGLRLGHYRRADELLDAILMAKDVNG
jgi:putative acetyltransferase